MSRTIRSFSHTSCGHTSTFEAYTEDGFVWKWVSNDAICPLDACTNYDIPCDAKAQRAAKDAELAEFLKNYKPQHPHTAEALSEMRNAFGDGATVVNVITGKKTKL